MIEIWRADTRLLVAPAHSARGFSRTQMAMSGHQAAFCAFLPRAPRVQIEFTIPTEPTHTIQKIIYMEKSKVNIGHNGVNGLLELIGQED